MRRFLLAFTKNPVSSGMLLFFLLALGLVSVFRLPLALMPDTGREGFTILTRHPGMDPEKMEQIITRPLEEAVSLLPGLRGLYSVSEEGSSRLHLSFERGADLGRIGAELRDQMEFASRHFPREAEKPVLLPLDPNEKPVMIFSLRGEGTDLKTLRGLADDKLKPLLEKIEGIGEIIVSGGQEREVNVLLRREKLSALNLSPTDVVKSLQDANLDLPAGRLTRGDRETFIRVKGRHESLESIRRSPIYLGPGKNLLRLEDLGEVDDGHKPLENLSTLNGEERITVYVQASAGANLIGLSAQVSRATRDFLKDPLSRGITSETILDASAAIRSSLSGLFYTLLTSALIASLFLALLLRNRRLLWIVLVSIPATIIPVFFLMSLTNVSINMISLAGLGMGIGMALDAGIVVMEYLEREKKWSLGVYLRALEKAAPPLLASTISTMIIFLPLLLMNESESVIYRDLALTVSYALAFSILFAFVLTAPLYRRFGNADFFLRAPLFFTRLSNRVEALLKKTARLYKVATLWVHARPLPLFGSLFLFLAIALALFPFLPRTFRGENAGSEILATLELPSGTSLTRTGFLSREAETSLRSGLTNHLKRIQTKVETGQASFYITVQDLSPRKVTRLLTDLRNRYRNFHEGFIHFTENTSGVGNELEVSLELLGDDTESLEAASRMAAKSLGKLPGVEDILFHFKEGRPVTLLVADRRAMGLYDLNPAEAGELFRGSLYGPIATKFLENYREVDVRVKVDSAGLGNLDDLLALRIPRTNGAALPLGSFVNVVPATEKGRIYRKNKKRIVSMTLRRKPGDLERFYKNADAVLAGIKLPEGMRFEWGGDFAAYQANKRELFTGVFLAVALIFLLLASLYQDLRLPWLVLASIPLGMAGVIWTFFIFREPLGIAVYLGAMILAGLVVNHAIIMLDAIRDRLKHRKLLDEKKRFAVILDACAERIRPIFLTAGTSLVGILPVLVTGNANTSWFYSLSLTLFSGLLVSLILSMFVIPILAERMMFRKKEPLISPSA